MTITKRLLLFFFLPLLSVLIFPPKTLAGGLPVIAFAVLLFAVLAFLLWRKKALTLTLLIFLVGFNVIIRTMMFFPHIKNNVGAFDIPYIIASLLSIALSTYLLFRLDQGDVRAYLA